METVFYYGEWLLNPRQTGKFEKTKYIIKVVELVDLAFSLTQSTHGRDEELWWSEEKKKPLAGVGVSLDERILLKSTLKKLGHENMDWILISPGQGTVVGS